MNLVDETGSEKPKSTNCKPGGKKNEKEKIINCIGSSNLHYPWLDVALPEEAALVTQEAPAA